MLLYGVVLLVCGANIQQKLGLVFLAAFWLTVLGIKWAGGKKQILARRGGAVA